MVLGIVIAALFAFIVYFHYEQGFLSATISAILAVISASLAFSLHEWIVESWLTAVVPNVIYSAVLIVLFAVIYSLLRATIDTFAPNGVRLPIMMDRVGGALMGLVAATFCMGTFAIAAEELPFNTTVGGYASYQTDDNEAKIGSAKTGQMRDGMKNNELHSSEAGSFNEDDRKHTFPWFMPGVDEMMIRTVAHLSAGGSLAGAQPLTDIHPNFLQEIFGQRIGIEGGAQHVLNPPISTASRPVLFQDVLTLSSPFRLDDFLRDTVRAQNSPTMPSTLKKLPDKTLTLVISPKQKAEKVCHYYIGGTDSMNGQHVSLVVIRLSFGKEAFDPGEEYFLRMSPGCVRLVAPRAPVAGAAPIMHDYYPIGEIEADADGTPHLYSAKVDDSWFIGNSKTARPAIDLLFAVDTDDFIGKDRKVNPGAFVEFKRIWREDLGGKDVNVWEKHRTEPTLDIRMMHQKLSREEFQPPPGTPPHE